MEKSVTYETHSSHETIALGKVLGCLLQKGDVIALMGELGSGKTWLTKGIAKGLGIEGEKVVTSPSFTLVNNYEGKIPLYHMDAYRLETLSDFLDAGLDEYFYLDGVAVLEWADRWPEILPGHTLTVQLRIINDSSRKITLRGTHPRTREIIEQVQENMK